MQPQATWSFGTYAFAHPSWPEDRLAPTGPEGDNFLCLISRCVDALHLMGERLGSLEDYARRTGDGVAREKTELRADIASLRTRVKLAESTVEQMGIRLAQAETAAADRAAMQARDLASACVGADAWRQRAEAEHTRLDAFADRLASLEAGLADRLQHAEVALSDALRTVGDLRVQMDEDEASAATLGDKLMAATRAMAEQRARIGCLQAKLVSVTATAALAAQAEQLADAAASEPGVMDLALIGSDRHTTAA